jgi:FkbM family methyltransferase
MALQNQLARIHNLLGQSNTITKFALKIRNQANAIVGAHFSGLDDPALNGEYALIDIVAPAAVNFIDVGANKGNWSSRFVARMKTPCGLIVDANSRCIESLRAKFRNNPDLTIVHAALSDYCGENIFYEGEGDFGISPSAHSAHSAFTPFGHPLTSFIKKRSIVSTLDDEVKKLGWTNVSMLKIDAEGHDFFVLRGARKLLEQKRIDFVQFECNFTWNATGINIVAAVRYLAEFDYQVFQLRAEGLRAIDTDKYGSSCGSANWLAFHPQSPNLPLRIFS